MNAHRRFAVLLLLLCAAAALAAARKPPKPPDTDQPPIEGVANDAPPIFKAPPEEVPVLRLGTAKGSGRMTNAALVTVDPEGFVYTGDVDAGRVLRFTPAGKFDSVFFIAEPRRPWTGLAADRGG
ncbi:MAG TPA: hypothetical protein VIC28_18190, partial [Thermoanaerobaculia bacterium]